MAVDLSNFDLSDPKQFSEAADATAKSVHETFGESFAASANGEVFINVGVLEALTEAYVTNALVAATLGKEELGIEFVKSSLTLNALIAEVKSAV